jgi:hypothetical protein
MGETSGEGARPLRFGDIGGGGGGFSQLGVGDGLRIWGGGTNGPVPPIGAWR